MIYTNSTATRERILNELNHCVRVKHHLEHELSFNLAQYAINGDERYNKMAELIKSQLAYLREDVWKLEDILDERNLEFRYCSVCGKAITEGYMVGEEYACSDECAVHFYNGSHDKFEEDLSHADEMDADVFWTEWY